MHDLFYLIFKGFFFQQHAEFTMKLSYPYKGKFFQTSHLEIRTVINKIFQIHSTVGSSNGIYVKQIWKHFGVLLE